jgi:hypothetical protein
MCQSRAHNSNEIIITGIRSVLVTLLLCVLTVFILDISMYWESKWQQLTVVKDMLEFVLQCPCLIKIAHNTPPLR